MKIPNKKVKFALAFLFVILSVSFVIAQTFSSSSPQFASPGANSFSHLQGQGLNAFPTFNEGMCEAGQDFILQIDPLGCEPSVVRSDLLEDQNVPIFCPIVATQINPLIDVNVIDSIVFRGDFPSDVAGIGFHPARAAVKATRGALVNSPVLGNIGYAVIVLRQNQNESSMPDSVKGNLIADIRYDVENAFGTGKATYYLPVLDDNEWQNNHAQYGFWNGKGFLRAELIEDNNAAISVYLDEENTMSTFNLQPGETSGNMYLPGLYCQAGLEVRLDGLEAPDTRAKLNINGEIFEVKDNAKFLENKCTVTDLEKVGISQRVSISCNTDNKVERFDLRISPGIELNLGNQTKSLTLGDSVGIDATDESKSVYLVYVRAPHESTDEEDLTAIFASVPGTSERLNERDLNSISRFLDRYLFEDEVKIDSLGSLGRNIINSYTSAGEQVLRNLFEGESFREIKFQETKEIFGTEMTLRGFSGAKNQVLEEDDVRSLLSIQYENAKNDYETIIQSYSNEIETQIPETTFGERALVNLTQLATSLGQMRTVQELCVEFEERYPDSNNLLGICGDDLRLSNSEASQKSVVINGNTKAISFEGVKKPNFDEYGAKLDVRNSEGEINSYDLTKDQVITLSEDGAFIQLVEVGQNSDGEFVRLRTNLREGVIEGVGRVLIGESTTITIREGFPDSRAGYLFTLRETNLEQVAKVSVLPNVRPAGTEANVSFEIGIEKRAIQLSPDKIRDRLDSLNESIKEWQDTSDKLGEVTEGLNAACLATGATLTIKNFFENLDGKSIARQEVMRSDGGWTDKCNEEVAKGTYTSLDSCFLENNDEINQDVEVVQGIMESQATITEDNLCDRLGDIREDFGEGEVTISDPRVKNPTSQSQITFSDDLNTAFTGQDGRCEQVSLSQARDLERFNRIIESDSVSETAREAAEIERYRILSGVNSNVEGLAAIERAQQEAANIGLPGMQASTPGVSQSLIQPASYYGVTAPTGGLFNGSINSGERIQLISHNDGSAYYVTLNQVGNVYTINRTFSSNGEEITDTNRIQEIKSAFPRFNLVNAQSYNNRFVSPEVKYFETEPYKGLPAQVPFDLQRGWYASVQQTLPGFNNVRAYDDSGAVGSFWLCNVGPNGRADFNSATLRTGDDNCQQYNPSSGRVYGTFPGLDEPSTASLVREAMSAVNEAARAYRSGLSGDITINGQRVPVGSPAVNVPEFQCQDFMSPQECSLLFNVCDPVVCPSSRCNLGGEYHVPDVVQSGIVGSTLLCLPNSVALGGDTIIPVCLTGIKAGIDGLNSVQQNYYDCLKENLESGRTIGICDEIHSIYLCDFFWSQAEPLSKVIVPKIFEFFTGQGSESSGSSGGGEYLGVQSAWRNAQDSAEFFGNYFSQNSFEAFGARATGNVGSSICKNFISATYPTEVDILDPRSPVQYTAWFEEASYTTATVPPASRYKVFFHIFAGNDISAQYSVYLREPTGTSFYQTNPTLPIRTGFIPTGEYASETIDLTGPSGYRELCVRVNAQEECGFERVSTSFALDYLQDSYLEEQASQTDINSQAECISGSPSSSSLINPNLQAGVTNTINPDLQSQGIVRVCSTDNPGKSTDPSRWSEVGTCDGGRGEVRCYIDTNSVMDAIEFGGIENRTLSEIEMNDFQRLQNGSFLSEEQFREWIERLDDSNNQEKISLISGQNLIEKVILNIHKARLYLIKANAHGDLALEIYDELGLGNPESPSEENNEVNEEPQNVGDGNTSTSGSQEQPTEETVTSPLDCSACSRDAFGIPLPGCSQNSCETLSGARISRGMDGCEFISGGVFGANQCVVSETVNNGGETINGPTLPEHNEAKVEGDLNNQQVRDNLDLYNGIISEASNLYGVEEPLIKAIILQESTANSDVVGDDGSSFGLMQISQLALTDVKNNFNDAVVRGINSQNYQSELLDVRKNIHVGTAYFSLLRNFYVNEGNSNEDANRMATLAYNWGRGSVNNACEDNLWVNCADVPNERLQYVSNILEFRDNL